jgi:hypothetical protein
MVMLSSVIATPSCRGIDGMRDSFLVMLVDMVVCQGLLEMVQDRFDGAFSNVATVG